MFMTKDEWSEDDLDDLDDAVVPISMEPPKPQVIMSGAGPSDGEPQYRASAYNERMARARNAMNRKPSSGFGARHTRARPAACIYLCASPPCLDRTCAAAPTGARIARDV